ncbi:MAG TPA: hypothetical protein VL284_17610, partial [Thermoanaerobaculia bacterium]|nr:hypothetical protein [Thermoanaerobaculia bacterium]
ARIDNGVETPLVRSDLNKVDHYDFTSPTVLRWRSRLPDDPPFANKEIDYVLRYTLSGVLQESGGNYTLNHDFAFPDRAGVIEHFSLRLDIDPVWHGAKSPLVVARDNLLSGESAVVRLKLQFTGATPPESVTHTLSAVAINAVLALLALAVAFLLYEFVSVERAKGRFTRIPANSVDDAFLKQNLFVMLPEVAGFAIDGKTAAPEVAAVLARMTQEGKLSSHVESRGTLLKHKVLCLTLLADDHALQGYEQNLVHKLFFGAKTTDTDRVAQHYKSKGFDPAAIIEGGIKNDLQKVDGWMRQPRRANWKLDWIVFGGALLLMIVAALRGGNDTGVVIFLFFAGMLSFGCASLAANMNAPSLRNLIGRFAIPAVFLAPLYWLAIAYTHHAARTLLHLLTPVAICAWAAVITKMTLDGLRSPESPERIALRQRLYAARDYFIAELRSKEPRLRDDWYPYLLAFGLGPNVDRWFGSYGASNVVRTTVDSQSAAGSFSSSSSSTSASFTGGGGAFGGAGASGGWAIAAATMGAGVSSPSSGGGGSSGSSGSSGGSSSGGGGGGGW